MTVNIHQELALADELRNPAYADLLARRDFAGIAMLLNAPVVVANPDKTPHQVPVTLTLKMVMADVPPAEMVKAYSMLPGFVPDVKQAIDNQDREYLGGLLLIAVTAGAISQETAGKLQPLLTATETVMPPATIDAPCRAAELGIGAVDPDDVQTMQHRYLGV
jgi:hypothetical protein